MDEKLDDVLAGIQNHFQETNDKLAKAVEKQATEIKELGGTNTATSAEIKKLSARYDEQISELKGTLAERDAKFEELMENQRKAEAKAVEEQEWADAHELKDVGEFFAKSDQWKNFDAGRNEPMRLELPGGLNSFGFKNGGSVGRERKDITSGADALRNVLARNEWSQIFGLAGTEPVRLRDHMTVLPATGASYVYTVRTQYENNAAFQASESALKATSNWTFTEDEARAHTIAHSTTISRQQARELPTVISFMRTELFDGLYDAETQALLFADGTAGSFKGIYNRDGVQRYAETHAQGAPTAIDVLRRSEDPLTDLQLIGDLYVMNHRDWTDIEVLKDDADRYLWVNVQVGGSATMWRKPVLPTRFMTRGEFINGGFKRYARLLDFEKATLNLYPQHADLALRNQVLMLAEMVVGLAVTTPEGFVIGNLDGSAMGSGS